jgi:hypothetical protein
MVFAWSLHGQIARRAFTRATLRATEVMEVCLSSFSLPSARGWASGTASPISTTSTFKSKNNIPPLPLLAGDQVWERAGGQVVHAKTMHEPCKQRYVAPLAVTNPCKTHYAACSSSIWPPGVRLPPFSSAKNFSGSHQILYLFIPLFPRYCLINSGCLVASLER